MHRFKQLSALARNLVYSVFGILMITGAGWMFAQTKPDDLLGPFPQLAHENPWSSRDGRVDSPWLPLQSCQDWLANEKEPSFRLERHFCLPFFDYKRIRPLL